jgi:hypothetical protein
MKFTSANGIIALFGRSSVRPGNFGFQLTLCPAMICSVVVEEFAEMSTFQNRTVSLL